MAAGSFRIKTKNDWNTIYFRFKQGKSFDLEISTGVQIPKGRWSQAKQEVLITGEVNYKELNAKLKDYDAFIRREYELINLSEETTVINSKWLKEKTSLFFNRVTNNNEIDQSLYLTNFIESYILEAKNKKNKYNSPISNRTIQHYQTCLNKVEKFESSIGVKIKLTEVDLTFHTKFIEYLEKTEKLNPNTTGGYIDDIKQFINSADKKGLKTSLEIKLKDFYSPTNETNDIYLKEDEINLIFNLRLEQDYLDNSRDWFIIGLRTGLRISDFLKLTTKNIIDGFIEKKTIKTSFPVIIPIHPQVKVILEKRNGKFPRSISDPKFNEYIKIVAEKAGIVEKVNGAKMCPIETKVNGKKKIIHRKVIGIYPKNELVTSHICRRSFATNLYGKLDTLTIMKITGHTTESQFLSYIKITPRQYAERLKELWKKTENL
jgi:integrase